MAEITLFFYKGKHKERVSELAPARERAIQEDEGKPFFSHSPTQKEERFLPQHSKERFEATECQRGDSWIRAFCRHCASASCMCASLSI